MALGKFLVAALLLAPALASAANTRPATTVRATRKHASSPKHEASDNHAMAAVAAFRPHAPAEPVQSSTRSSAPAPELGALPMVSSDAPPLDAALVPSTGAGRRVTLTLNPLPMALGRFGANAEFLAAPHHAFLVSAYLQSFPTWMLRQLVPSNVDVGAGPASRPGGEVGYRLYTGANEATGLFVGASALAMPLAYPRVTRTLRADVVSFEGYGGALDIGVQVITDAGFTLGGGLGVMYVAYTPPASVTPPPGWVDAPVKYRFLIGVL